MGSHVDAWKKLRHLLEDEDQIEYINIDHNPWEASPWTDCGRKKEPDPNKADTGKRFCRQILIPFRPATIGDAIKIAAMLAYPVTPGQVKGHIAWLATWTDLPNFPFIRVIRNSKELVQHGTLQVSPEDWPVQRI
jgi:hypothetical protein